MKKQRLNIFETNSSSTNCLILGDVQDNYNIPETLSLYDLCDGRDFEYRDPDSRFSVLASLCDRTPDFLYLCYKVQEFGVKNIMFNNIRPYSDCTEINICNWEIDYEECQEILSYLNDDNLLKAWLFSPESEISGEDDNY